MATRWSIWWIIAVKCRNFRLSIFSFRNKCHKKQWTINKMLKIETNGKILKNSNSITFYQSETSFEYDSTVSLQSNVIQYLNLIFFRILNEWYSVWIFTIKIFMIYFNELIQFLSLNFELSLAKTILPRVCKYNIKFFNFNSRPNNLIEHFWRLLFAISI